MPCSMCFDSINVISVCSWGGDSDKKAKGSVNVPRGFVKGRFLLLCPLGDCGLRSGGCFVPGRITTEDLKLTQFLAAQRKAFNFPYFRPGDCNLHLQENEGVIFLVSRHLG